MRKLAMNIEQEKAMHSSSDNARIRPAMRMIFAVCALGVISADVIEANDAPACQNLICPPGYSCGGNGNPPGLLNICSPSQVGGACTYCDGETKIRICAGLGGGGRNCTLVKNQTQCGQGWDGTCTKALAGYYYCASSGNMNQGTCQSPQQCSGDVACPAG